MSLHSFRSFALAAFAFALALLPGTAAAQRPAYTAVEQTLDVDPPGVDCVATPGGCFKIHWVTSTGDAPAATDVDPANGRADYIDQVAQSVAEVYVREIRNFGWPAPPSDAISATPGGDGRHDVYVRNVSCGGIAFVQGEGAVAPGSSSWYSFTTLGRDMRTCYAGLSGPGDLSTMSQLDVIRDVFAHEYHHAIQLGMQRGGTGAFREATANWMNDEAYDGLNVNVLSSALGDFTLFESPATSVNNVEYGGWFWLRYLSERFGHNVVKDIWRQLAAATTDDLVATSTVLTTRGTTLRDAWIDFTGKLYAKEWFEEGRTYPDVATRGVAATHATYPVPSRDLRIDHMARRYVRFNPQASSAQRLMQLFVNGPDGQDSGAVVVLEMADGRRVDARMALDVNNDGSHVVSGFGTTPPPAALFARATSAVLGLANATRAADALLFRYCGDDCAVIGGPDAMITPWGVAWGHRDPLWQSVDVWVDNDGDCRPDMPGRPGCNEPDDPATPVVDAEPTRGRVNTLFARVRNLGDTAVTGATVRFQYSPFGIALPPIFATIGTTPLTLAPAGSPGDEQVVSIAWDLTDLTFNNGGLWDVPSTPAVETTADFDHFCVQVHIDAPGDVNLTNNSAQNNFGDIPVRGAMRTARFLYGNPFPREVIATIVVTPELPEGWRVKLANVPVGKPFRLKKGEFRLGTASLMGPANPGELNRDIVANLSLVVDGVEVSGLSIRLATATKPCDVGDVPKEQDAVQAALEDAGNDKQAPTALWLSAQAAALTHVADRITAALPCAPFDGQTFSSFVERQAALIDQFKWQVSRPRPEEERAPLWALVRELVRRQQQLEQALDTGKEAGPATLVVIDAGPELDEAALRGVVDIYDHYFDTATPPRHYLLGRATSEGLARLAQLPARHQVVDPEVRGRHYYWLEDAKAQAGTLQQLGARVVWQGPDVGRDLIALPAALGVQDLQLLRDAHPRPVVAATIDPSLIRRPLLAYQRDLLVRDLLPFLRRDPDVVEMLAGFDGAACRTLLEQLTGNAPITSAGAPYTVRGRLSTSADTAAANRWLRDTLTGFGLTASTETFFSPVHGRNLTQVVATLPGTDLAHQLVAVSAHLDAVAGTPGADDNATGVAAMVCAAKQLAGHRFRRTVRFLAWNAEEQGLIGSDAYARGLVREGEFEVCGNLNLDMVAYDRDGDRRIQLQRNSTPGSSWLADRVASSARLYGLGLAPVKVTDSEESSDYASFWRVGLPAINIGDEYFFCDADCVSPARREVRPPEGDFTPCYHRSCDTLSEPGLSLDLMNEVGKMLITAVSDLAVLES